MDSPLKGLERLSEELKAERQKLNIALQERARVRLEAETHKQTIEQQKYEIQELNETIGELQRDLSSCTSQLESLQQQYDEMQEETHNKTQQYQEWLQSSNQSEQEISLLHDTIRHREEEVKSLRIQIETLEGKAATKDDLIASLKSELLELRKTHAILDQQKLETFKRLNEMEVEREDLEVKLQLVHLDGENLNWKVSAQEDLRAELEQSLTLNTMLNKQLREVNEKLEEKFSQERRLQENVSHLTAEKQKLEQEVNRLQLSNNNLQDALTAEKEAKKAVHERCDTVVRNRTFLDEQVEELRAANHSLLDEKLAMEKDLLSTRQQLEDMLVDLHGKEGLIGELSAKAARAEEVTELTAELDSLRAQLLQLRKQMIKRDLEEQAGVLPPKAIIDREQQGRSIYEGIISSLREELERMTLQHDEMARKYDVAMEKASRVDLLVEEVSIYQEMARNISKDSQTVALAASEVTERNIQHSHERQHLLHELHKCETNLLSIQAENKRLRDEVDDLKEKMKTVHAEKMATDRRATEVFASQSRSEATLEDLRRKYDILQIEMEKAKRTIHDCTFQINDLSKKEQELHNLRIEYDKQCKLFESSKSSQLLEGEEKLFEGERAKQQRDLYRQEAEASKIKLEAMQRDLEKLLRENQQLMKQLESALREKDQYKNQVQQEEQSRIDQQLGELKRDLAQSLADWDDLEHEKKIKDTLLQELQTEYTKEKEHSNALSMQLRVLEEKMKIASQELSVFRSLDVYNSSLQAELKTYREEKATSSSSAAVNSFLTYPKATIAEPMQSKYKQSSNSFITNNNNNNTSTFLGTRNNNNHNIMKTDRSQSNLLSLSQQNLLSVSKFDNSMQIHGESRKLSLDDFVDSSEATEYLSQSATEETLSIPPAEHKQKVEEDDKEEKQREELLLQRSKRKAIREQQLREKLLQEERSRSVNRSTSRESSNNTSPLKSMVSSQRSLKSSIEETKNRNWLSNSKPLSESQGPRQQNYSSYRNQQFGGGRSITSFSQSYQQPSQTVASLSRAKSELDRARRLISM